MTIAAIAALLLPLTGPLQSQPAPLDTLVDVGGYHLHMVVYRGTQPLTIVMESGGGASLAAWSGVEVRLAERTGATVVAYDRAGFGESGMGPMPGHTGVTLWRTDRTTTSPRCGRRRSWRRCCRWWCADLDPTTASSRPGGAGSARLGWSGERYPSAPR